MAPILQGLILISLLSVLAIRLRCQFSLLSQCAWLQQYYWRLDLLIFLLICCNLEISQVCLDNYNKIKWVLPLKDQSISISIVVRHIIFIWTSHKSILLKSQLSTAVRLVLTAKHDLQINERWLYICICVYIYIYATSYTYVCIVWMHVHMCLKWSKKISFP